MAQPSALPQQAPTPIPSGASLSDLLSAVKNLVLAISTLTQDYLNVQGLLNASNISTATVIKQSAGRLAVVSVISAGTTLGYAFDATSTTIQTRPLGVIPNAVGVYPVNIPYSFGLVISPGTGQAVTVSYS